MDSFVDVLLRWLHIFPVIVLVGGAVGGKFLNVPIVSPLSRNAVFLAGAALVGSGLVNMMRVMPTVPKGWHMWFGIKVLLSLHVLTMIFLMTKVDVPQAKRARWQTSALIGAALIVAVAAYMRHLRGI
ncbi:hypothetical protein [Bryobacter aggregatus]|uniref:hypothetical protein n=1 Tax=Bryobacter aggregatus TaxID=360054 RepID=UPI0004E20B6F|nr:hypothetical protein [Bryobacter aggregatus]